MALFGESISLQSKGMFQLFFKNEFEENLFVTSPSTQTVDIAATKKAILSSKMIKTAFQAEREREIRDCFYYEEEIEEPTPERLRLQ